MLITNRAVAVQPLEKILDEAFASGARLAQLREKNLDAKPLLTLARSLRDVASSHDAKLLVNGRLDIALAVDADGLHLPEDSLPVQTAKKFFRNLVGRSVHNVAGALDAERSGADYLVFGHVFETVSKASEPRGLNALEAVCKAVSIPVYAVGGITPENARRCLERGAFGVATMNGVMSAIDARAATVAYLDALRCGR
ncbi:MAG: thiamine phosphate synthase [Chloroherpetonaceae bacterium]|nr:thiamine phosphate synthase [Chloroherpetonaceae bacterium]